MINQNSILAKRIKKATKMGDVLRLVYDPLWMGSLTRWVLVNEDEAAIVGCIDKDRLLNAAEVVGVEEKEI